MDDDKLRRDEHASVMRSRNLFLGVTLIVVGVLWMMNNLELLSDSLFDVVFSWQMLLVLIGGYLLALRKWLAGGIVAAVGLCLLLIDQLLRITALLQVSQPRLSILGMQYVVRILHELLIELQLSQHLRILFCRRRPRERYTCKLCSFLHSLHI